MISITVTKDRNLILTFSSPALKEDSQHHIFLNSVAQSITLYEVALAIAVYHKEPDQTHFLNNISKASLLRITVSPAAFILKNE